MVRRAFDENGLKIGEQIFTGELIKRKQSGKWPAVTLEKTIRMTLPDGKKAARFETEVLDLVTGARVRL